MKQPADTFVTIDYFCKVMLGLKTRYFYYAHVKEPGMPQRVYVGGEPRLSLRECEAYVEQLKSERGPQAPPLPRRPGRPRKSITPPAAA
jgi:hypothetical protein